MKETNHKGKALLLAALMMASVFGMAACQGPGEPPVVEPFSASSGSKESSEKKEASEESKKTEELESKPDESASSPESSEESSGKESSSPESSTPESSEPVTGEMLKGTWKVDPDHAPELNMDLLPTSSSYWSLEKLKISKETMQPTWVSYMDTFRIVTFEDGTFRVEEDLLQSILLSKQIIDLCMDAFAEMSFEEVAEVTGGDADTIRKQLELEGMTWKEYCDVTKKQYAENFQLQYDSTKEKIKQLQAGEEVSGMPEPSAISPEGRYIVMTGTYEIKDGKIIAEDSEHSGRFTLSYSGDVQTMDDLQNLTESSKSESSSSEITSDEVIEMLRGTRFIRA